MFRKLFQLKAGKHLQAPNLLQDQLTEEISEEDLAGVSGGRFVYWVNAGGYRIGAWVY